MLKILIDTGSNKNYIQSSLVKNPKPNDEKFFANSVGGKIEITHHTFVNLFGLSDTKIKFFLMPHLTSFHGILGNDSLKDLAAIIHTRHNYMIIRNSL